MYPTKYNSRNSIVHISSCVGFVIFLALPATGYSQQWRFEPVVEIGADYNDNLRLNLDDQIPIDATALVIDANGRFVRRAQTSEIRIAPRIRSSSYTDNSSDDSNDVFLDLFAKSRYERGEYGIQARFSQEDVLTAEIDDPDFDNPDVNDPVNLDTGRIQVDGERETLVVSPFFAHEWTETIGLGIDASYVDVSYDQSQLDLTDYASATVGTSLSFRVSERSAWSIRVFGNDYEADSVAELSESNSIGASIDFTHQFTQSLQGQIGIGYEDIDSDVTIAGVTVSDSDTVTLFSAGVARQGEISRVVAEINQAVDPGGDGFLQSRSQLRLRYTRQLSPKMYGNFEARIQNTEELSTLSDQVERDFQRYRIGLERRLSQKWAIRGDYSFTSQDFSDEIEGASSNAVSISFVYQPERNR